MDTYKFTDFTFINEPEAPDYKARMTLEFDGEPNWDILVSRIADGTLIAEITTPAGHEYFPASLGVNEYFIRDIRREAITRYTYERNKAHC